MKKINYLLILVLVILLQGCAATKDMLGIHRCEKDMQACDPLCLSIIAEDDAKAKQDWNSFISYSPEKLKRIDDSILNSYIDICEHLTFRFRTDIVNYYVGLDPKVGLAAYRNFVDDINKSMDKKRIEREEATKLVYQEWLVSAPQKLEAIFRI